jgi:hypothetical protein
VPQNKKRDLSLTETRGLTHAKARLREIRALLAAMVPRQAGYDYLKGQEDIWEKIVTSQDTENKRREQNYEYYDQLPDYPNPPKIGQ